MKKLIIGLILLFLCLPVFAGDKYTVNSSAGLKICPFCRSMATMRWSDKAEYWLVICDNSKCGNRTDEWDSAKKAAERWNRR
jgi:hypothetical protein